MKTMIFALAFLAISIPSYADPIDGTDSNPLAPLSWETPAADIEIIEPNISSGCTCIEWEYECYFTYPRRWTCVKICLDMQCQA